MCSYSVLKNEDKYDISYMEYDIEGYTFEPKTNNKYLSVTSVTIYDKDMIDNLINKKFHKKFERLSSIVMKFLFQEDDDCDEGDFMMLIDEVQRLESLVVGKYQRFLEVEEYKDYIHKLAFLDQQLREKLAIINYKNSLYYEASQGRSM